MTLDELTELTQGLLDEAGFHLGALRDEGQKAMLPGLTDQQFLLAVRFVAGERVESIAPAPRDRPRPVISEEEAARRLNEIESLDDDDEWTDTMPTRRGAQVQRDENGQVDIGDGVFIL